MTLKVPVRATVLPDWVRLAANAINGALRDIASDEVRITALEAGSGGGGAIPPATSAVVDGSVLKGTPLIVKRSNGHLAAADASVYTSAFVIGLADADTTNGFVANAIGLGAITLTNWTNITGTTTLSVGMLYYLKDGGGLSLNPPTISGHAVTVVGEAISSTSLYLRIGQPLLL